MTENQPKDDGGERRLSWIDKNGYWHRATKNSETPTRGMTHQFLHRGWADRKYKWADLDPLPVELGYNAQQIILDAMNQAAKDVGKLPAKYSLADEAWLERLQELMTKGQAAIDECYEDDYPVWDWLTDVMATCLAWASDALESRWHPCGHQMSIALGHDSCTCLLYTSPSPRDRQKSRMPSSA